MPKILIPLPDVYETVTRRVAVAVTSQLARTMRLGPDTRVYLPGQVDTVPMNGGTFGDCCDTGVRYPAEARMIVRFTEELDEAHTLTTKINTPEQRPLFYDTDRGIVFRPTYRYVNLQASFEYTAPSIVVVQRWLDEMRARISMLRAELYQDLEYHYGIPKPAMMLLKHLYDTMEASEAPTGLSFDEYVNNHFLQPVKTATTLIGTESIPVVPEHQYEVLGWFDFTTTPSEPTRNENGTYTTSFTYTLHYNRPMQLFCEYPLLVHNRPIDLLYRPQEPYESFQGVTRRVSTTKGAFDSLLDLMTVKRIPYIHHPDIDTWVPPKSHTKRSLIFFTGLLQIRSANPRTLVNLFNLGDFTFTPFFLEYLYLEHNRAIDAVGGVFDIRLYENDRLRSDIHITLDTTTMSLMSDRDLDLTKFYHIQIGIRRDWHKVDTDVIQGLRKFPVVAYSLLRAVGVYLGDGRYEDLDLLGQGRLVEGGQCTIIGDPAIGGMWPWPWLEAEWDDIDYPGTTWDTTGWPGGGWDEYSWPEEQTLPTWPSDIRTGTFQCGGMVSNSDMQRATERTINLLDHHLDRKRIGPLNVLYACIIAKRRKTR